MSPIQSRQRPQLGVSGQQTHADIWVERQSATFPSVPPRCLLSYGLTRSRNCSSPTSHTHTHAHTHHHRHTCTLNINSSAHKNHTPHISFTPDCYGSLSSFSSSLPPPFFLSWRPLRFFCLRPTFKCLFICRRLIVLPAKICLKLPGLHILHYNRSH